MKIRFRTILLVSMVLSALAPMPVIALHLARQSQQARLQDQAHRADAHLIRIATRFESHIEAIHATMGALSHEQTVNQSRQDDSAAASARHVADELRQRFPEIEGFALVLPGRSLPLSEAREWPPHDELAAQTSPFLLRPQARLLLTAPLHAAHGAASAGFLASSIDLAALAGRLLRQEVQGRAELRLSAGEQPLAEIVAATSSDTPMVVRTRPLGVATNLKLAIEFRVPETDLSGTSLELHMTDLLLLVASVLTLSLVCAYFLSRWLRRPLEDFTLVAKEYSHGNTSRVPMRSPIREFHDMGDAFLCMVRSLQETTRKLAVTLDCIGEAVVVCSPDGHIIRMNRVAESLTGWRFDEARGRRLPDVLHLVDPTSGNRVENTLDQTLRTRQPTASSGQLKLIARSGVPVDIRENAEPMFDEAGELAGAVLVMRDMTTELAQERRRQQAQKMETIGRLAGGIAHDFNNALGGILCSAEILDNQVSSTAPTAKRHVQRIIDLVERTAQMTRRLLAFSRSKLDGAAPVDLNAIVRESLSVLRATLDSRITIEERLSKKDACCWGNSGDLQNMLLNLLVNAREAMPTGGQIQIRTRVGNAETLDASAYGLSAQVKKVIVLSVSDTGVGMSEAIIEHIFEPFFTTKRERGGSGLGLASAYRTVKAHGGGIRVWSQPGKGTTFSLCFPAYAGEASESPQTVSLVPTSLAGMRVLVVDDEEHLRINLTEALTGLGCEVVSCQDGASAVAALQANASPFSAALLDVVLPDTNGSELATTVSQLSPPTRIIFMSGFSALDSNAVRLVEDSGIAFLRKPFRVQEVVARLMEPGKTS